MTTLYYSYISLKALSLIHIKKKRNKLVLTIICLHKTQLTEVNRSAWEHK